MLDFSKLLTQIVEVGVDSLKEENDRPVLENALGAFDEAAMNQDAFIESMVRNAAQVLWPVADCLSPFAEIRDIDRGPDRYTVVAVDGSQIMPSHHEVHSCYLLNAGSALISYGEKHLPELESSPQLYHRPEDLYPLVDRRRIHIDELYVSLERTVYELEILASKSIAAAERGLPVLALFDGSIIPWSLDKMNDGYQESFIERIESPLKRLKERRIPLIGYISHSRSSDVVNMLRTFICPYDLSDCKSHCGHLNEEDFPCSRIWPLTDRALYGGRLALNQISSLFQSSTKTARLVDTDCQACFLYARFESEVARLEMPQYLSEDEELFRFAVAAVRSQVEKGMGYPVSLAEAHHLAVIKGGDRDRFFDLITRHLVGLGGRPVKLSPKERNKRMGFV
ncbi:MAG: DNA double-strand break repair nuclease NurA [Candidatus Obscuribacterales bacterium]|nr:DNA double-strand break repair nuclease NurA [Candidatus Obscuribacterales bacterium]